MPILIAYYHCDTLVVGKYGYNIIPSSIGHNLEQWFSMFLML